MVGVERNLKAPLFLTKRSSPSAEATVVVAGGSLDGEELCLVTFCTWV